ncbi:MULTISPECIES: FkbM family methyltransferase [unclassified Prochlorococcus]|uniref:FkbM family methyltransferase n=1 Tax=unclassified Prochlorococcus TaxID=2627481 RepID=UPI000533B41F|nr:MULTISPECIES: FkbM family methyltransferase [unclassified Prochlorococcus]KGG14950.1 gsc [Prochlorococcus sp. MIT 0602]KGG15616.1 gsc [Prochlorococcus sp. MIT 0603]
MRFTASPNPIKRNFRSFFKKISKNIGLDITRYSRLNDSNILFKEIIKSNNINIVFDVGANIGLFSIFLREIGYKGQIVCFEPISKAYSELLKNTKNQNCIIYPQSAVGDSNGEISINISGHTGCSSILPILDSHTSICPGSEYVSKENVPINTLDDISTKYIDEDSNLFLKIDTQGYEWNVLDGADNTLRRCKGILIELSLLPLYLNQKLWWDIIDRLKKLGFSLWHLETVTKDPDSHRLLQLDAIFIRTEDI